MDLIISIRDARTRCSWRSTRLATSSPERGEFDNVHAARIAEAIGREDKRGSARRTFTCHADRDAFLSKFVHDYNRTRLKCLGYQTPIQALANLTGPNTFEGTTAERASRGRT